MNLAGLDRALTSGELTQSAQPPGIYVSKTDQTVQTDQCIEITDQFGAPPGQELTSRATKLTSGTVQQPHPGIQVIDAPAHSTHACTNDRAPDP